MCTRRGKSLGGPEQVSEFSKENAAHTVREETELLPRERREEVPGGALRRG